MSDELDPVVTVSVLKSELTLLRSELKSELTGLRSELRSELKSELTGLRSELRSELTGLRSEMKSELTGLRSELKSEVTGLRSEMTDLQRHLEKRISEEGAITRAHFDIMVEKVNDSVRLVAEVNAHHATIPDNHESRLQKIEER